MFQDEVAELNGARSSPRGLFALEPTSIQTLEQMPSQSSAIHERTEYETDELQKGACFSGQYVERL